MPKKPSKKVTSKKVTAKKATARKAAAKKATAKKAAAKKATAKKAAAKKATARKAAAKKTTSKKATWREPSFGLGMSLERFDSPVSLSVEGNRIEGTRWLRIRADATGSRAGEGMDVAIGYGTNSLVPFFEDSTVHWDETWVVVECLDEPCVVLHASYLVTERDPLTSTRTTVATYRAPPAVFGALHGLEPEVAYAKVRDLTLCDVMEARIIYSDDQGEVDLDDGSEGGGRSSDWMMWTFGNEDGLRLSKFVEEHVCRRVHVGHVDENASGAAFRWDGGSPDEYTGNSIDSFYLRIAFRCRLREGLPNMWLVVQVWYENYNLDHIEKPERHLGDLLRSEANIDAWVVDETIGLTQALCATKPRLWIAMDRYKNVPEPGLMDHNWAQLLAD